MFIVKFIKSYLRIRRKPPSIEKWPLPPMFTHNLYAIDLNPYAVIHSCTYNGHTYSWAITSSYKTLEGVKDAFNFFINIPDKDGFSWKYKAG